MTAVHTQAFRRLRIRDYADRSAARESAGVTGFAATTRRTQAPPSSSTGPGFARPDLFVAEGGAQTWSRTSPSPTSRSRTSPWQTSRSPTSPSPTSP